jgi:hypothetical protein
MLPESISKLVQYETGECCIHCGTHGYVFMENNRGHTTIGACEQCRRGRYLMVRREGLKIRSVTEMEKLGYTVKKVRIRES